MEIVPVFDDVHLDPDDVLRRFGLQPHGPVQTTIDNSVMRYMEPYWAHGDTRVLARSCYTATDAGSGMIVYPGPYAHYMYHGVLYTDEIGRVFVGLGEKKPINTGIPLKYSKEGSPLAGAYPLNRMKADHLDDILEEARAVARDQQR